MGVRLSDRELKKILKDNINIKTKKSKKNKYHNTRLVIDGIRYDSKKEYERHCELILLEKAGEISELRFHDKKDIIILQDKPLITYEPDFCYKENDNFIIEDLKGYQTKEFKLKKKMIIHKIINNELLAKLRLTKYESGEFKIIEEYDKNS